MRRVLMLVEGQTEETFVRELLAPHLWARDVAPIPVLATTKVVKSGPNFKGGLVSYGKARNQIMRLLLDTEAVAVTTMLDLNALPSDFPGYGTRPMTDCYRKVAHLEQAFSRDINHLRFKPYLQLHEFEAFMFVDPDITAALFAGAHVAQDLRHVKDDFGSPEEIDEEPDTAPSKRILAVFRMYEKTLHGPLVTIDLGLGRIRDECPHFNQWLTWLEGLAARQ
jgi:hypothetical protein